MRSCRALRSMTRAIGEQPAEPRVRGVLLQGWAVRARGRFGEAVFAAIRARVDSALPDAPDPLAWYPVRLQLEATNAVREIGLRGDTEALVSALVEDGMESLPPAARRFVQLLGPHRVLARAGSIHPHLYDVGSCEAVAEPGSARLCWRGSALFGDPTWQLLQVAATRGLIAVAGGTAEQPGTVASAGGFTVSLRWSPA